MFKVKTRAGSSEEYVTTVALHGETKDRQSGFKTLICFKKKKNKSFRQGLLPWLDAKNVF